MAEAIAISFCASIEGVDKAFSIRGETEVGMDAGGEDGDGPSAA
jgi:hypothetical protein